MSYPGYPSQGQGVNPNGPPYPAPNPGYPTNNLPYPNANPPYPTNQGVFAPALGFSVNTPMYMPPAYPPAGMPGIPQQGGYPPVGQPGYPQIAVCPPAPSHYAPPVQHTPAHPATAYPSNPPHQSNHSQSHHSNAQDSRSVYTPPVYTPTLKPYPNLNVRSDAEALRKAMKGFGTDEVALIKVLTKRTNVQRLLIAATYKSLYGKDLLKTLKSETSGAFEDVLVAMITPTPQYYAMSIYNALHRMGTLENVLIEIFCTMNNVEIATIVTAYEQLYHNRLESKIRSDTSGTFQRILVSLCTANRDQSVQTDLLQAAQDASNLYNAGEKRRGTDETTFISIFCQRSYPQLALIFKEYAQLTGHDIDKAIKGEFSGDSERALLAISQSVRDRPSFFAECFKNSTAGMGTKDNDLIRLIVTRSEIDLADVKSRYSRKYGKDLKKIVQSETSGDYGKCLLSLMGD